MRIQGPRIADAYDSLLRTTRDEAGSAMTEAWKTTPIARDEDMPLGEDLNFPRIEEERAKYVQAVAYELQFPPLRWTKEHVVPRLVELRNNSNSGRHPRSGSP